MRTTNTFGIQFITGMNKVKDGLAPIYARVTVDARRVEISLKRFINPVEWNGKRGVARGNREEVKSLNHYLEEVRSKLVGCYAATRKCKSKNGGAKVKARLRAWGLIKTRME